MIGMTMTTNQIDKDRLRAHANRHITKVLDALGVSYVEHGPLFQACCPIKNHPGNGDNDTAWSWKEGADGWRCWTHGCDDTWGGDVFGLVQGIMEIDFRASLQFVLDILSNSEIDLDSEVIVPQRKSSKTPHMHVPIPENCLKFLVENYDYPIGRTLLDRGYDPWVLKSYGVGYWHQPGSFMNDRLIFPLRDHEGFLVGFSGRTVFHQDQWERRRVRSKWVHGRHFSHWPPRNPLSKDLLLTGSIIYNLFNAKNRCPNGHVYVVEGPLDGLKLEQAGIQNWIALLGVKNFSQVHKTLLIQSGINRLSLAFDPDKAGQSGIERVTALVQDFFHVDSVTLPGKDPGDMTTEEIKQVFV